MLLNISQLDTPRRVLIPGRTSPLLLESGRPRPQRVGIDDLYGDRKSGYPIGVEGMLISTSSTKGAIPWFMRICFVLANTKTQ